VAEGVAGPTGARILSRVLLETSLSMIECCRTLPWRGSVAQERKRFIELAHLCRATRLGAG
jgi:hypothetical protein